jgi:hypothetical protein
MKLNSIPTIAASPLTMPRRFAGTPRHPEGHQRRSHFWEYQAVVLLGKTLFPSGWHRQRRSDTIGSMTRL